MDYMDKVELNLKEVLKKAATVLREARPDLPGDPAAQLETIASQVSQPCIVAVVGQVKAGKSSFINALLRDNLARVGTTETTATINYFRYHEGKITPERTVCCFYRTGQSSYVSRAFLDGLQGNDIETLRQAGEIDHLEYYLRANYLKQVTVVDTPGINAAVHEHQNVTAEFMRLHQQLRNRHDKETRELGDTADAVIYLISAVAGSADQKFLEDFHQLTQGQSQAFNAVGVMSKIDLYPQIIERRAELSAKIATQLQENLNTVVPISAGIRRALDALLANNRVGLKRLVDALSSIAPGKFDKFFSNPSLYLRTDPDWPLPVEQRKALRGDMEWKVFATIAHLAANHKSDLDAIGRQLNDIAGFDRLREVLEQHIFQRSRLLRCYNKVKQARQVLSKLRFLSKLAKRDDEGQQRLERFLKFIQQAHKAGGDTITAQELEKLVKKSLALQTEALDTILDKLDRDLANIFYKLEQYNIDFGALQTVIKHAGLFSSAEVDELQSLLGRYGLEPESRFSLEYVKEHQRMWKRIKMLDPNPVRRQVAEQAEARYGFVLEEMVCD